MVRWHQFRDISLAWFDFPHYPKHFFENIRRAYTLPRTTILALSSIHHDDGLDKQKIYSYPHF